MSELERKEVINEELDAVNGGANNGVILCKIPIVGDEKKEARDELNVIKLA